VVAKGGGETVSIPSWWTQQLRKRILDDVGALRLHLGDECPDLDQFVQPLMDRAGDLFYRADDETVYAVRGPMAFRWRFAEDGDVRVDGFTLGRRVAAADIPKDAAPPTRGAAKWN
jgi:hypothetical protein